MTVRRRGGAPRRRHDALPGHVPHLSDPAEMDAVIRQVAQTRHAFRVPYLVQARDGELAFSMPEKGEPVPASFLKLRRPRLVILSDDHPDAIGPDAWPQAVELFRWATTAVLQVGAGNPFRSAVIGARWWRRAGPAL